MHGIVCFSWQIAFKFPSSMRFFRLCGVDDLLSLLQTLKLCQLISNKFTFHKLQTEFNRAIMDQQFSFDYFFVEFIFSFLIFALNVASCIMNCWISHHCSSKQKFHFTLIEFAYFVFLHVRNFVKLSKSMSHVCKINVFKLLKFKVKLTWIWKSSL